MVKIYNSTLTRKVPLKAKKWGLGRSETPETRRTPQKLKDARKRILRAVSKSPTAQTKKRIQALVREIAILRDGGCLLRDCRGYGSGIGSCSGPLQGEHLISRSNSATFGDSRNVICLCQKHHIFWKPQHSRLYWDIVEKKLGPTWWNWVKMAEADSARPHKVDFKLVEIALQRELDLLQ